MVKCLTLQVTIGLIISDSNAKLIFSDLNHKRDKNISPSYTNSKHTNQCPKNKTIQIPRLRVIINWEFHTDDSKISTRRLFCVQE